MSDRPTRPVLHAVASGGMYGIEHVLSTLLPELRAAGWPAELLCLNAPGTTGAEVGAQCAKLEIPVHYLPLARGIQPRDVLTIWRRLWSIRPALLHVHGYKATTLAGTIGRVQRIPVVGTVHSEVVSAPEIAKHLALESRVLRRLSHVVAVSDGVAADVVRRGVSKARVSVIRNGIANPGPVQSQRAPTNRAVIIGRLVEPKNTHVAIAALGLLAKRGLHPTLVVAGDGPERSALEALADSAGVAAQVEFLGFVADVAALLAANPVFVMPSRSEGIPIALLEAMAHGLTILASRVGGIPEVVDDRREALLVQPDNAEALAAALESVLRDPGLAQNLGDAARARYERDFQAGAMRERYEQLYRRILS